MILTSIIIASIAKMFQIIREPNEMLSFYNRALIGHEHKWYYKPLTCAKCHAFYMALGLTIYEPYFWGSIPLSFTLTYLINDRLEQ